MIYWDCQGQPSSDISDNDFLARIHIYEWELNILITGTEEVFVAKVLGHE